MINKKNKNVFVLFKRVDLYSIRYLKFRYLKAEKLIYFMLFPFNMPLPHFRMEVTKEKFL